MKKSINIDSIPCTLLALLFIALKLTHQIDWSWAWILAPIWIPLAVAFPFILFLILYM